MSLYALICCFRRYYEQNWVFDANPLSFSDARIGNFRVTLDAEMKRLQTWVAYHLKTGGTYYSRQGGTTLNEPAVGYPLQDAFNQYVYYYNCKMFELCSYVEHRNVQCNQYQKEG